MQLAGEICGRPLLKNHAWTQSALHQEGVNNLIKLYTCNYFLNYPKKELVPSSNANVSAMANEEEYDRALNLFGKTFMLYWRTM